MISCTTIGSQRLVICINQEEGERGRTNSHPGGARENHRNWTVVVHCGITKVLWDAQTTFRCKEWQRQIRTRWEYSKTGEVKLLEQTINKNSELVSELKRLTTSKKSIDERKNKRKKTTYFLNQCAPFLKPAIQMFKILFHDYVLAPHRDLNLASLMS